MAIIDHGPEAGFMREMAPADARRQLQISLSLVGLLGALALGFLIAGGLQLPVQAGTDIAVKLVVQSPEMVHVRHAASGPAQPGG